MKYSKHDFDAILARRHSTRNGAMISRILKSGKPGKPFFVAFLWNEKSAKDVVNRLEALNPGVTYVEA